MILQLHPDEYISNCVRKKGFWEAYTTEVLMELFKYRPNTIFVDIGANIGYFSIIAASYGINVIAFEPVQANSDLFEISIGLNGCEKLITLYKIPLSDRIENISLNICNYNMGLCSSRDLDNTDYTIKTTTSTLDNFDSHFGGYNLIVKIDVECMEQKVLQGMLRTLEAGKITHIIIEMEKYNQAIKDIMLCYKYDYYISIGFDREEKTSIDGNSTYLSSSKYVSRTINLERSFQTEGVSQQQLMFIRTSNPLI